MTFQANVGDASIAPLKIIKRKNIKLNQNDAPFFADIDGSGSEELIYTSGDSIYVLKNDLTPYLNNGTGLFSPFGGKFQPALARNSLTPASITGLAGSRDSSFVLFAVTFQCGQPRRCIGLQCQGFYLNAGERGVFSKSPLFYGGSKW